MAHELKNILFKDISFFLICIFLFLHINILICQNQKDSLGRKQGYWKVYYPNSKHLEYEGFFKDNQPQGLFKYYYEHDTIKAKLLFKKNGHIAYATLYHYNGKIMSKGKYIDQKKDSVWEFYNEEGKLINRENYLQGQKHGLSITYYDEKKIYEKTPYILGKKYGYFIQYFPDGKIKAMGYYKDNLENGLFVYYAPNGTRVGLKDFKDGILNGVYVIKDEKGKVIEKSFYKNGKEVSEKEKEIYFNQHPEVLNNDYGLDKEVTKLYENINEKNFIQDPITPENKSNLLKTINSPDKNNLKKNNKSTTFKK